MTDETSKTTTMPEAKPTKTTSKAIHEINHRLDTLEEKVRALENTVNRLVMLIESEKTSHVRKTSASGSGWKSL